MTRLFTKGRNFDIAHTERECHVKIQAKVQLMLLSDRGYQRLPERYQKPGERHRADSKSL